MDTKKRLQTLREKMGEQGMKVAFVSNFEDMYYLTGYKTIIYSRPIVLAVTETESFVIVPGLEEDQAKLTADVTEVYTYYEHPEKADLGASHLYFIDQILAKVPAGSTVGVQYGAMALAMARYIEDKGYTLADVGETIKRMRYIKSEEEIEMMVEAGKLVSEAMRVSLANVHAGVTEMEMDAFGNNYLMDEVPKRYPGATLDIFVMSPGGTERTNMPHVFSNTRPYDENEIILHSRQVGLNGYRAEIERTLFIGEPSKERAEVYQVMVEAQAAILAAIRPGLTAGEADALGRSVIQEAGLGQYSNHRAGHGIGLGLHEEPYLRYDSDLVLEEGMAFSVEPGIYVPHLGGFRFSDTVILTKDGSRKITDGVATMEELTF